MKILLIEFAKTLARKYEQKGLDYSKHANSCWDIARQLETLQEVTDALYAYNTRKTMRTVNSGNELRKLCEILHVPQQVTATEWHKAQEENDERDVHPCDHWNAAHCMCTGSCSCHWREAP